MVRFNGNWADEIDVEGWFFGTRVHWEDHCQDVKNKKDYIWPRESSIGTNEQVEFYDVEDYLSHFDAPIEMTEDEFKTCRRILNKGCRYDYFTIGFFLWVDPNGEGEDE